MWGWRRLPDSPMSTEDASGHGDRTQAQVVSVELPMFGRELKNLEMGEATWLPACHREPFGRSPVYPGIQTNPGANLQPHPHSGVMGSCLRCAGLPVGHWGRARWGTPSFWELHPPTPCPPLSLLTCFQQIRPAD